MTDTNPTSQQELRFVVEPSDDHTAQPQLDRADDRQTSAGAEADSERKAQPPFGHAGDDQASPGGGADDERRIRSQGSVAASPVCSDVPDCNSGHERAVRARGSMLWAAYGDALGFISELVNRKGLEARTQGAPLDHLMDWKRRVGGRSGVHVLLPAGCWSDDTQLRMAVSRSLSGHGFDVETFARIELPVWLSYALGGGRASKAAAKNLGKPRTLWYANTFPGWADAGGNGAAMRIQPHVWASQDLDGDYMLDVMTDSVCTHGHPRAIVGACFHAATLAHCLKTGAVPDSDQCLSIAAGIGKASRLIENDSNLGRTWIGLWEQQTGKPFRDSWRMTVEELHASISEAAEGVEAADRIDGAYAAVVDRLGLRATEQRGSGILTTVAAAALAATASKAHEGVVVAANAIGTDTDTIASMAGALLGACDGASDPPEEPLDVEYLQQEADRLTAISMGHRAASHPYPDVLTWIAPQTQADALVSDNGSLAVEGLGKVTRLKASAMYTAREDFAWEWVATDFGQTLLVKRRPEVKPRDAGNDPAPPAAPASDSRSRREPEHRNRARATRKTRHAEPSRGTVDRAVIEAREQIADDAALGSIVRDVAQEGSLGDLLNFMRIIRDDLRR